MFPARSGNFVIDIIVEDEPAEQPPSGAPPKSPQSARPLAEAPSKSRREPLQRRLTHLARPSAQPAESAPEPRLPLAALAARLGTAHARLRETIARGLAERREASDRTGALPADVEATLRALGYLE